MNKSYFQNLLRVNPFVRRSDIYNVLSKTILKDYGVTLTEQQIQKIVRAHRTLQELIPNDEKGKKLEAQWRDEHGMKSQGEFVRDQKPYYKDQFAR